MSQYIFTRARLRAIVPDLTAQQEDAIIELYLAAAWRFKNRMIALETENKQLRGGDPE